MSLASAETLSNSGLWNSKHPAVTLDMVSASLSPMNGDRPDSLRTAAAHQYISALHFSSIPLSLKWRRWRHQVNKLNITERLQQLKEYSCDVMQGEGAEGFYPSLDIRNCFQYKNYSPSSSKIRRLSLCRSRQIKHQNAFQVNSASYLSRDAKWVVAYALHGEGLV